MGDRFSPNLFGEWHVDCFVEYRGDQVNRMLRITVVESSKIAVTLRVEGRITGPWVEELRTACNVHTFPDEVQLSLELADISFADAAGIALLRELRNRGVGLMRTTPFLAEQLKDGTSSLEF
jgi:hypothetical protein